MGLGLVLMLICSIMTANGLSYIVSIAYKTCDALFQMHFLLFSFKNNTTIIPLSLKTIVNQVIV